MNTKLLAQGIVNPVLPSKIGNSGIAGSTSGGSAVGLIIGNIIGAIVIIAFLLALFYLLMGGVSWITSGGDKAQLESSRNKITHSILGLIIVAAVWAIMNIIAPFLGLNFPNLDIPTIQP